MIFNIGSKSLGDPTPVFNFTGLSDFRTVGQNWELRLLSSGILTWDWMGSGITGVDIFAVGGGGGGVNLYVSRNFGNAPGAGGGGGYTKTLLSSTKTPIMFELNAPYRVEVGARGFAGTTGIQGSSWGSATSGGASFIQRDGAGDKEFMIHAAGGEGAGYSQPYIQIIAHAGSGGSGGSTAAGIMDVGYRSGAQATNGSNGQGFSTSGAFSGLTNSSGKGQGTTTIAFGDGISLFSSEPYANGGYWGGGADGVRSGFGDGGNIDQGYDLWGGSTPGQKCDGSTGSILIRNRRY